MNVFQALGWFFLHTGILFGSWVSRIPDIKDDLDFSNSELGLLLLAAAVGALLALPLAHRYINRAGSARTLLAGGIVLTCGLALLGRSVEDAFAGIFLTGFGVALSDVGMTTHGIIVEKWKKTTEIGKLGALNCIGNVIGSLLGGYLASSEFPVRRHLLIVGVGTLPVSLVLYFWLMSSSDELKILTLSRVGDAGFSSYSSSSLKHRYKFSSPSYEYFSSGEYFESPSDNEDEAEYSLLDRENPSFTGLSNPFLFQSPQVSDSVLSSTSTGVASPPPHQAVRLLCFLGFMSELIQSTVTDWSTIYFKEDLDSSPMMCTIGYAIFSFTGAIGMVLSDELVKVYLRQSVIRYSACLGIFGMTLVALSGFLKKWVDDEVASLFVASLGLAVSGGSISCIIPIVFSAAGDIPQMKPSEGVAMVTGISYFAFLSGPPIFGYLSDVCGGLKYVFIMLTVLGVLLLIHPGNVPNNRYGMMMLLSQRRAQLQSTDVLWQDFANNDEEKDTVYKENNENNIEDTLKIKAMDKHLSRNKFPIF